MLGNSLVDKLFGKEKISTNYTAQIEEAFNRIKKGDSFAKAMDSLEIPYSLTQSLNDYVNSTDRAKLSAEEFAASNSNAMKSVSKTSSSVSVASKAMTGLSTVLKTTASVLANMAIGFAIGAAITGAIKLFDELYVSAKEANEAMDISFSGYEDAKSQVESINSELDSTNSRISELQSKGSLTFVEKSELANLKEARKELELQQDLAEKAETKAAKDAGSKALQAYEKSFGDFEVSQERIDEYLRDTDITRNNASLFTDENNISALIAGIQQMKELQREAKSEGDLEEVERYQGIIDDTTDSIWNQITSLENYKSKLSEIPEALRTEEQTSALNEISDTIDFVYKKLDPNKWKELKFDEILSSDDSFDGIVDELEKQSKAAGDAGITVDDLKNKYPELASAITGAGMTLSDFVEEINAQAQGIETATTDIEALESSFRTFQVSAVDAINQVDTLNAALVNSFSGKGLEIGYEESEDGVVSLTGDIVNLQSAYADLEGYNPELLFERTANGVHINREALRALQAQEEALTKQGFIEKQTDLQNQLAAASQKLKEAQAAGDSVAAADQQNVISTLQSQIENVQLLASAYDGATSSYQKWLNAQSSGEEGDMFRTVSETMKERGNELYEEGRYNTEEFRAIADYFSYEDLSTASMEEVVKAYQDASNARDAYFTGTKEGIDNFMADMMRISESEGYDWIKTTEDGFMEFNTGADEEIAKRFNLSTEAVQALFRAASEYTDNIRIGDTSGIDNLDQQLAEATQKAEEAKSKLKELQDQGEISTDIKLDVDVSQLDESGIEDRINQLTDLKEEATIKFGADSSEVEYVDQLLNEANARKEQLAQQTNVAVSVDINGEEDLAALGEKLSTLPKDETSNVSINIQNESQLDGVVQQIEQVPKDTPVNLSLTVQNEEQADALEDKLSGLASEGHSIQYSIDVVDNTGDALNKDVSDDTKTITVNEVQGTTVDVEDDTKTVTVNEVQGTTVNVQDESKTVTVNYTKGSQAPPDDKNATVNYNKGKQEKPSDENAFVNYLLGSQASPIDKTASVNYTLGSQAGPSDKTAYVNYIATGDTGEGNRAKGTFLSVARSSGTAYNTINTIPAHAGGNVALPKNEQALVNEFAPQSPESIVRDGRWFIIPGGPHIESLKKGDIIFNAQQTAQLLKAGKTSSPGKAFAEGTMPHVRNLVSTSLNAYADGSDDTLEYIDWIERIFNKLEREFTHITNQMERIAHLTDKQVKAYEALAKNREYLNTTQSAISTYRSHLNSIGLSSDIINKIKNGSLEITQYDEDTRELISEYQDYYTKLQDCSAQYDDLLAQQDELAQTALDNVSNYYDMFNQVDQAMQGWLEAQRDLWENQGLSATADSQYASIQSSLEQERKVAERLEQKISSYTDEINKLISNGYMARHSEAYYEANEALNGFKQELYESQSAIIEFEDQLRELDYTALQNKIDGFARAVDKISAQINLMEARDEKVPESVYQQQIDANNNQIEANQELRASKLKEQGLYDVGSTRYQELAEEINDLDVETLNLLADNEALKDSIYELRFDRLDNQLKVYDDLKTEIDDFRSLLNEDAFFDKNGVVTEEGLAELALLQQGIIASKREVADYREGLEKLKESYVNGVISLDEYNEKSEEYCAGIRESIKDVSDYEDALTDLYMAQMKTESEALQEVIDKRKEALQAKESYYQYDQKLKSQTKDVNMLLAQIQALEGVNNATAEAEAKRLRAELETAQQTLDDTKREHAIDMQQQGYDSMSDQLNQILEDTEYEITHNAEKQQEVVQSMLNNVVNMYESAYGKINSIIENTGWAGSYAFRQNQTQLSTSTGAQTQTNNATQSQSNVKPSDAANSTITNPIDNNESYNNKVEQEITQAPNTENRLVAELKLSPTSVSLEEGKSTKITASMRPNDAKNKTLSWKSSNTSIATVSGGTIKAIKAGSCQITASTTDGSGLSVTVGVTVTAKPKPVQPEKKPSTPSTGGDGVPNIGDAVTYTSGRYYYSSDGLKPSGNQYLGKTVYIGHINNADWATKPYALYADKEFKHPLGWVSLDQISGYAKGTKSVPYEQIAEVNEEGRELIVTSDGRVLRRLQPGDGVIPNNITENLLKMGENPAKFVQDAITQVQTPVVNKISSGDMNVTYHYDSLLTVNGNVDKEALPELKEILKKSYDYTVQNIAKDAAKMGFKKRF